MTNPAINNGWAENMNPNIALLENIDLDLITVKNIEMDPTGTTGKTSKIYTDIVFGYPAVSGNYGLCYDRPDPNNPTAIQTMCILQAPKGDENANVFGNIGEFIKTTKEKLFYLENRINKINLKHKKNKDYIIQIKNKFGIEIVKKIKK